MAGVAQRSRRVLKPRGFFLQSYCWLSIGRSWLLSTELALPQCRPSERQEMPLAEWQGRATAGGEVLSSGSLCVHRAFSTTHSLQLAPNVPLRSRWV